MIRELLPTNHSVPWTDDEIQGAIHLHKSGMTWAQAAEAIGRTENALLAVMRYRGYLGKQAWTAEDEQQALAWKREGASVQEIAARTGRTAQAVATKLSVLGRDPARARAPQFDGIPGWGPFLRWHSTI